MKSSGRPNYRALFTRCSKQSLDKDQLIALFGGQLRQMADMIESSAKREAEKDEINAALQTENTNLKLEQQLKDETIQALSEQNSQLNKITTAQNEVITGQQKELDKSVKKLSRFDEVRHELRLLKRQSMGINSEKQHRPTQDEEGNPILNLQLSLALDADTWGVCRITDRKEIGFIRTSKTTIANRPGGRHDFTKGLPEEIIVLDVDNKPPGATCIGHVDQRQLACDPLRWYIKIIRRLIYLSVAEDEITHKQLIAPLPPHPIPRCKMDISVLVMLVTDKYLYHLPVYRQRRRFLQYGVELPYSTLCYYVNRLAEVLEPLQHLLLKEITVSRLMHVDETTYRVLDNTKKKGKKSHLGWMWALMNPVQRICCFMYQKGRGKKDIASVLKGYKGILHTDGYKVYDKYGKQSAVVHQKCAAHLRRYFDQALENDRERATYALEQFFGPLYQIEEECKLLELDYDGITEKRQAESVPVLRAMYQWLSAELPRTIPRTPIHKAIAYAMNHFEGMIIYTTDGMLQIDSNALEREIRGIALGRHNYMFAGSHRGGEYAAIIYSLLATCKLQNIDPSKWLSDVLRRITTQPKDKLIELLPQFWKPQESLVVKTIA